MWIVYAIISMLSSASRRIYDKHLTTHFSSVTLAFAMNIIPLVASAVALFFLPLPLDLWNLPITFWAPLLIGCAIVYPVQVYLYLQAIRGGEVSSVAPLVTIVPVFNIATSFIFLKESPTLIGFLGVLIIVFGVYLLLKKKGVKIKSRPEILMIFSMALLAVSATLDKMAIDSSTLGWYLFMDCLVSTIALLVCVYINKQQKEFRMIKSKMRHILIAGSLMAVTFITMELAFSLGHTSYVLAIRSGSFVLASLWGIYKLKEAITTRKIVALCLFIFGTLLLAFA